MPQTFYCEEQPPRLHGMSGAPAGAPLLLLHGVTRAARDFAPVWPALAAGWQVFALDFRGHGLSERTPGHYRVVDYVEDAVRFLRRGGGEPMVVYGHSLGAMVAAHAALLEPDRVRALVLEDPPFETLGQRLSGSAFEDQFRGLRRVLESGERDPAALAAKIAEIPLRQRDGSTLVLGAIRDPTALRFHARCLADLDPAVLDPLVAGRWLEGYPLEKLTSIACPVLLLQADPSAGGMLIDEEAGWLAGGLPHCIRVRFAGAGHQLHWTATEPLLRQVLAFLHSL